jgi:hypothetical protein
MSAATLSVVTPWTPPTDEPETAKPLRRYGNKTMNNYVFVIKKTVISIAAFSYHQALEILVATVGIDSASPYLFSEL